MIRRTLSHSRLLRTSLGNVLVAPTQLRRYFAEKKQTPSMDVDGTDPDFRPKEKTSEGTSDASLLKQIEGWVKENKVVLFMKGNPQMPMCGYSKYVVEVLKFYGVQDYKSVDVLKDEAVRRLVKQYSDWPTFPQLYVNGELVGGCDIVTEMHKKGSLKEVLSV